MSSWSRLARPPAHAMHPDTASRRLLAAVLERAMRDAAGPLGTGSTACTPRERERAHGWFRATSIEPMSFRWLCLVLDLDPDAVVQRLALPGERTATSDPAPHRVEGELEEEHAMAASDIDDLVAFHAVRVVRTTATALLCAIGERTVWLPREHVTGRLFSRGDRGTLLVRRWVALDRRLAMPRPAAARAPGSPPGDRHGLHAVADAPRPKPIDP